MSGGEGAEHEEENKSEEDEKISGSVTHTQSGYFFQTDLNPDYATHSRSQASILSVTS